MIIRILCAFPSVCHVAVDGDVFSVPAVRD